MPDDEHSDTVPANDDSKGSTPDVAPQSAPVEPRLLHVSGPAMARPDLRKKDLIDAVLARCEVKKRDAKPVIEAMLAVLGETLAEGRGLNLEPLGKLRVNRTVDRKDRRIVVCKLRQKLQSPEDTAEAPAQEPEQGGEE